MRSLPRRRWLALAALAPFAARADLVKVVAAVKPAIVAVGTFNPTDSPRFGFRGTGFAVGDGTLVVTNAHVLPGAEEVEALGRLTVLAARDGKVREQRKASVVMTDRQRDLALLKIEGAPLPTLTLADADEAREGQAVALIGFPIGGTLGFAPVTHHGIIAAIASATLPAPTSRQLEANAVARIREGEFQILQLDATAYPGNSGGPLIDADTGRVLGVVNMVLVKGSREAAISQPTGISYAIPVRHVSELLRQAR
jgi:S1-C subfamily serine protease